MLICILGYHVHLPRPFKAQGLGSESNHDGHEAGEPRRKIWAGGYRNTTALGYTMRFLNVCSHALNSCNVYLLLMLAANADVTSSKI